MDISLVADEPLFFNNGTGFLDFASLARRKGVFMSSYFFEDVEDIQYGVSLKNYCQTITVSGNAHMILTKGKDLNGDEMALTRAFRCLRLHREGWGFLFKVGHI